MFCILLFINSLGVCFVIIRRRILWKQGKLFINEEVDEEEEGEESKEIEGKKEKVIEKENNLKLIKKEKNNLRKKSKEK